MLEQLHTWDRELFLFLNGLHTPWTDKVFYAITTPKTWVLFYVFLAFYVFWRFGWKRGIWIVLPVAAAVGLADVISSQLFKPLFERLRPSHDPALEGLVHYVNGYKGGLYGFVSSHAATAFALASGLFFMLRRKVSWIGVMFVWATIYAYSRVAVGVHYVSDIFFGALIGMLSAYGCTFLAMLLWRRMQGNKELP